MSTAVNHTDSEHGHWYKKVSDFQEYEENPFLEQAVAEINVSVKRRTIKPKKQGADTTLLLVNGLGEEYGEASFVHQTEVDEQEFTKLFKEGVARIAGLSARGSKVWGYVCEQLKPGATNIHFMFTQALAHTGYKTRANVVSGLAELLEAGILARSQEPSLYFINPTIMFNGNRLTFAKTYVKKQIEKKIGGQLNLGFEPTFTHLRKMLDE
jgi:hypothetical protein